MRFFGRRKSPQAAESQPQQQQSQQPPPQQQQPPPQKAPSAPPPEIHLRENIAQPTGKSPPPPPQFAPKFVTPTDQPSAPAGSPWLTEEDKSSTPQPPMARPSPPRPKAKLVESSSESDFESPRSAKTVLKAKQKPSTKPAAQRDSVSSSSEEPEPKLVRPPAVMAPPKKPISPRSLSESSEESLDKPAKVKQPPQQKPPTKKGVTSRPPSDSSEESFEAPPRKAPASKKASPLKKPVSSRRSLSGSSEESWKEKPKKPAPLPNKSPQTRPPVPSSSEESFKAPPRKAAVAKEAIPLKKPVSPLRSLSESSEEPLQQKSKQPAPLPKKAAQTRPSLPSSSEESFEAPPRKAPVGKEAIPLKKPAPPRRTLSESSEEPLQQKPKQPAPLPKKAAQTRASLPSSSEESFEAPPRKAPVGKEAIPLKKPVPPLRSLSESSEEPSRPKAKQPAPREALPKKAARAQPSSSEESYQQPVTKKEPQRAAVVITPRKSPWEEPELTPWPTTKQVEPVDHQQKVERKMAPPKRAVEQQGGLEPGFGLGKSADRPAEPERLHAKGPSPKQIRKQAFHDLTSSSEEWDGREGLVISKATPQEVQPELKAKHVVQVRRAREEQEEEEHFVRRGDQIERQQGSHRGPSHRGPSQQGPGTERGPQRGTERDKLRDTEGSQPPSSSPTSSGLFLGGAVHGGRRQHLTDLQWKRELEVEIRRELEPKIYAELEAYLSQKMKLEIEADLMKTLSQDYENRLKLIESEKNHETKMFEREMQVLKNAHDSEKELLNQQLMMETKSIRDLFEWEIKRIKDSLQEQKLGEKRQMERQLEDLEQTYRQRLANTTKVVEEQYSQAEKSSYESAQLLEALEKLKLSLIHLMDVNELGRQCLEQMRLREVEYQNNLTTAKQNEALFESHITGCIKIDNAKQIACDALKKGRSIQLFLNFRFSVIEERLQREALVDLHRNAYAHLWSPSLLEETGSPDTSGGAWASSRQTCIVLRKGQISLNGMNKKLQDEKKRLWYDQVNRLTAELNSKRPVGFAAGEADAVMTERWFAGAEQLGKILNGLTKDLMRWALYRMQLSMIKMKSEKKVVVADRTIRNWAGALLLQLLANIVKSVRMRHGFALLRELRELEIEEALPVRDISGIKEPFPPIFVPPLKRQHPHKWDISRPPWEVPYMQHKPPQVRQRTVDSNFVAIESSGKRPIPPAPHFAEVPLDFLRHQFSVGLPLESPYPQMGLGREPKKQPPTDYRNMTLGTIGTGGQGYVPAASNYEKMREREATDRLMKTMSGRRVMPGSSPPHPTRSNGRKISMKKLGGLSKRGVGGGLMSSPSSPESDQNGELKRKKKKKGSLTDKTILWSVNEEIRKAKAEENKMALGVKRSMEVLKIVDLSPRGRKPVFKDDRTPAPGTTVQMEFLNDSVPEKPKRSISENVTPDHLPRIAKSKSFGSIVSEVSEEAKQLPLAEIKQSAEMKQLPSAEIKALQSDTGPATERSLISWMGHMFQPADTESTPTEAKIAATPPIAKSKSLGSILAEVSEEIKQSAEITQLPSAEIKQLPSVEIKQLPVAELQHLPFAIEPEPYTERSLVGWMGHMFQPAESKEPPTSIETTVTPDPRIIIKPPPSEPATPPKKGTTHPRAKRQLLQYKDLGPVQRKGVLRSLSHQKSLEGLNSGFGSQDSMQLEQI